MKRIFFDISYTRGQRENVGITRTVRRMFEEFEQGPIPVHAVAFARGTFVEVEGLRRASAQVAKPSPRGRLFALAASGAGKAVLTILSRLPWSLFRPVWEAGTTLAYAGNTGAPLRFQPGDVVLLADASWNYSVWKAARQARREGAQVAVVVYDLMPLRQPRFCAPLVVRIFTGWLREMLSCSDALVCISRTTEDDLRDWAKEAAVHLPPTGHFRLGSDPAAAASAGPVRAGIAAFMAAGVCFAAVGSVEPKKNYGFLLDTFERLWAEGGQARLLIAGRVTPEWMQEAERMRAHPEHGRRLLAVFDANDAEVLHIYAHCRALVFPSLMEGFGLPLVEGRSQGCPVIASDLPVFAELADQGVFLYARHSADALLARLAEHTRCDMRPQAGRMRPFLWKDSVVQCTQVVDSLLASGASARTA